MKVSFDTPSLHLLVIFPLGLDACAVIPISNTIATHKYKLVATSR